MAPLERPKALLLKHRDQAAEFAGLFFGISAAGLIGAAEPIPFLVRSGAMVVLALAPAKGLAIPSPGLPRFVGRLRVYGGVFCAVSVIAYFLFQPPAWFYLFGPIWLACMAAWYAGPSRFLSDPGFAARTAGHWGRFTRAAARGAAWVAAVRFDEAVGETCLLATLALLGWRFLPGQWPAPRGFAVLVGAWLVGRSLYSVLGPRTSSGRLLALLIGIGALGAAGAAWFSMAGIPIGRGAEVVYLWAALSLLAYRLGLAVAGRGSGTPVQENFRWIFLGAAWVFLFHPFFEAAIHGTPDANWYATMLADMVAQVRAGVFPVFAGQSEFQFNGAIYLLRVAPAFDYLGALVDAVTLHALGVISVQNLLLALIGLLALFTAYFSLGRLLRRDRWAALGLALLFTCCPGVLGIAFNTDLYMSWMAVPLVPIVLYGTIRSYTRDDLTSLLLVAGPLGAIWWCHTPIAMWTSAVAGGAQAARLLVARPPRTAWPRAAAAGLVFAVVAAYPVLSVLAFPVERGVHMAGFQAASVGTITLFLREVFPRVIFPLSPNGRDLGDFQVGYALWAVLAFAVWRLRKAEGLEFRVLLAAAAVFLALLAPIPGLNAALWNLVPKIVRNTTGNWVMNRLYLDLAALLAFSGALGLSGYLTTTARRRSLYALLGLACAWSLAEASKFGADDPTLLSTPADSSALQPENAQMTRFAYNVFPGRPDYFTHGVADAQIENRLFSRASQTLEVSNLDAVTSAIGASPMVRTLAEEEFTEAPADEGTCLYAPHPVTLAPGKRYLAGFAFAPASHASGILQFSGSSLFRNYSLPEYGGPRSFGMGGDHSRWVPLWVDGPGSEELKVRLFPSPVPQELADLVPFATMTVVEYDPEILPVRVESWIPYRARVRSADEAWLETPRMYQDDYRATVDGRAAEVRKSAQGLAMVAVPKGESRVTLEFDPPLPLLLAFWASFLCAVALACAGLLRLLARGAVPQD
jgi:hypothetical protein